MNDSVEKRKKYVVKLIGTKNLEVPADSEKEALEIIGATYHGWAIIDMDIVRNGGENG